MATIYDAMTLPEVPLNDLQTALLFPSKLYQDGLHRLFAWLREVVQIEPDSFTVVDPYDFTQVLSFDSLQREEKSKLNIITTQVLHSGCYHNLRDLERLPASSPILSNTKVLQNEIHGRSS